MPITETVLNQIAHDALIELISEIRSFVFLKDRSIGEKSRALMNDSSATVEDLGAFADEIILNKAPYYNLLESTVTKKIENILKRSAKKFGYYIYGENTGRDDRLLSKTETYLLLAKISSALKFSDADISIKIMKNRAAQLIPQEDVLTHHFHSPLLISRTPVAVSWNEKGKTYTRRFELKYDVQLKLIYINDLTAGVYNSHAFYLPLDNVIEKFEIPANQKNKVVILLTEIILELIEKKLINKIPKMSPSTRNNVLGASNLVSPSPSQSEIANYISNQNFDIQLLAESFLKKLLLNSDMVKKLKEIFYKNDFDLNDREILKQVMDISYKKTIKEEKQDVHHSKKPDESTLPELRATEKTASPLKAQVDYSLSSVEQQAQNIDGSAKRVKIPTPESPVDKVFPDICKELGLDINSLSENDKEEILKVILSDNPFNEINKIKEIVKRQLLEKIKKCELQITQINETLPKNILAEIEKLESEIQKINTERSVSKTSSEANKLTKLSEICDAKIKEINEKKGQRYIELSKQLLIQKKALDSIELKFPTRVQQAVYFLEQSGIRERKPDSPEFKKLKNEIITKIESYITIAHGGYFGKTGFLRNTTVTKEKIDDARELINNILKSSNKEEVDRHLIHSKNKNSSIQKSAHGKDWFPAGKSRYDECLLQCLEKVTSYKIIKPS